MPFELPTTYSAAFNLRAIALDRLSKSLPQYGAVPVPIMRLLVDQHLLLENLKKSIFLGKNELVDLDSYKSDFERHEEVASIVYSDFSFVVAPAYKAFEGFLIFIADRFGLPAEKYKHNIGGLYNWEANKKDKELIIEAIEKNLGIDREGKDRWRELNMVLRSYRHNPAHFSGDKISTFEQAEDYVRTIINTMNQTVKFLIEKKILYDGEQNTDAICNPSS